VVFFDWMLVATVAANAQQAPSIPKAGLRFQAGDQRPQLPSRSLAPSLEGSQCQTQSRGGFLQWETLQIAQLDYAPIRFWKARYGLSDQHLALSRLVAGIQRLYRAKSITLHVFG
jgi:hypothetical protein